MKWFYDDDNCSLVVFYKATCCNQSATVTLEQNNQPTNQYPCRLVVFLPSFFYTVHFSTVVRPLKKCTVVFPLTNVQINPGWSAYMFQYLHGLISGPRQHWWPIYTDMIISVARYLDIWRLSLMWCSQNDHLVLWPQAGLRGMLYTIIWTIVL